uniref:peptidylprolyl isomerase n=1 Tax=Aliamphritea ceti TaxID=1524258 RepID=UPI0035E3F972
MTKLSGLLIGMLLICSNVFAADNPVVTMTTSEGVIKLELYPEKAPHTVKNFLTYVENGFYQGTVFHRVMDNFMIQGGGFTSNMTMKETLPPIVNESANGLINKKGSISMARTQIEDSATAQFFINLKDNHFLNGTPGKAGYAVFGQVIEGMDVVEKIGKTKTGNRGRFQNVPVNSITINNVERS